MRRAQRIIVIEGGRVVEQGTHDELVAAAGRYEQMYRLQAARFAAGDDEEEAESTEGVGAEAR